ncbi:flagellar protein FlgN [Paenibacillus sp. NPDC058174]|uniref:flagellar protein FlgN n=1 Tax=Paenibacillus sp. NPDC058174 TaxID=3346366 RepID=UPI0036D8F920
MSVQPIIEILQAQLALYGTLLEIEKSKKPLIMSNDFLQLNVVTQKEKLLVAQAEELESNRSLITLRYFKDIGFRYRVSLLSEVIKSVSELEPKQKLMQLHEQLTDILKELQQINELNQQLIQQSIAFIDFSIDLMVEDPSEDVVYQHPMNQIGNYKRSGLFDSRG